MNSDPRGPHGHDETEGMFPHLHHEENVDEHGRHVPEGDEHGHHVHVTPLWPMVLTFVGLLILTGLTLLTAKGMYFGNVVNLVIALIIAGLKAVLVAAFFMHLLYDKAMNTIVVVATMFATVLFITITMVDMTTRDMVEKIEEGEIVPGGGANVSVDADGNRTVGRIGSYNPWYSEAASKSVLDIARENYKAKKAHDGEKDGEDSGDGSSGGSDGSEEGGS